MARQIEVEFHAFIRPEAKFESMDELIAQMLADCDQARAILGNRIIFVLFAPSREIMFCSDQRPDQVEKT